MSSTALPMPSGPRVTTADTSRYPHLEFKWAQRIDYQGNDWYTWTPKANYTTTAPAPHPTRLLTTEELDHGLYPNMKFEIAANVDGVLLWSGVPMNPYLRPELPCPDYKAFMAEEPEMIGGDEHKKWVDGQIREYKRRVREQLSARSRRAQEADGEDEELPTPQRNSRGAPRPTRYRDDHEEAAPAAPATTSSTRRTATGRAASRTTVPWTAEMRAALHFLWLEPSWDPATREAVFNHVFRDQLPGHARYSTMASQEGTRREECVSKREKWVPAMEIVDGEDGPGLLQELKEAKADYDAGSDDDEADEENEDAQQDELEQAEAMEIDQ
ncbi:hypothetical protein LTR56_005381 [Elasticomyces elasticus]|nr:hypothetical protein LTR22_018658 [Elasticomyces elasticus]KAK3651874.1 hypothetical protein LTR56_005381 [Elasticomyces elasticus]KAK4927769.1 hypothetical protein LTR49_005393 [Elasticomyces elasticus]KAK5761440.1 hypothetical protein LTS12_008401 [Elasticomyces elasticus]